MWLQKLMEEVACDIAKREHAYHSNWEMSSQSKIQGLSAKIEQQPTFDTPYFLIVIEEKFTYKITLTTLIDRLDHGRSRFIAPIDEAARTLAIL